MNPIDEIRRTNLELLIAEAGGLERVAAAADSSSVYLSQIRNQAIDRKTLRPRQMGTAMARRLEAAFSKPTGWMDTLRSQEQPPQFRGGISSITPMPADSDPPLLTWGGSNDQIFAIGVLHCRARRQHGSPRAAGRRAALQLR